MKLQPGLDHTMCIRDLDEKIKFVISMSFLSTFVVTNIFVVAS